MANTEARNQASAPAVAPLTAGRKRRWGRILLWSAGGLLALLTVSAAVGVLWLRAAAKAALPALDGDVHLAGLSAPVIVRRDAHGVPHIEASSEDDLFMAQGYVTAQDRLWQMDAFRRNANGELAEIMGPSMVMHDKTQRVLQLRNTARRIYANLSAEDRARLDAYARGVNLFISQHQNSLPPEFRLLAAPFAGACVMGGSGATAAETLPPLFDYLEKELGANDYFVGNTFSIADISVGTMLVNFDHAGEKIDAARWPKLAAFGARMHARPSFKTVIDEERPLIGRFRAA